jgi:hypothetical protein
LAQLTLSPRSAISQLVGWSLLRPVPMLRLIAAVGTLDETKPPDMALFERISVEIGDELLGAPGDLPLT